MAALILSILAGICLVKYLGYKMACRALVLYMQEKGYTPPTAQEVEAYVKKCGEKWIKENPLRKP